MPWGDDTTLPSRRSVAQSGAKSWANSQAQRILPHDRLPQPEPCTAANSSLRGRRSAASCSRASRIVQAMFESRQAQVDGKSPAFLPEQAAPQGRRLTDQLVAHALPKIEVGLTVAERALARTATSTFSVPNFRWRTSMFSPAPIHLTSRRRPKPCTPSTRLSAAGQRMEVLPTVKKLRAALPPRAPIEHAREWAISHRPKY